MYYWYCFIENVIDQLQCSIQANLNLEYIRLSILYWRLLYEKKMLKQEESIKDQLFHSEIKSSSSSSVLRHFVYFTITYYSYPRHITVRELHKSLIGR